MTDLLLAADMAYPLEDYGRLPAGCQVVLGYVGGVTPHAWTTGEIAAAVRAVGAWWPIWTAPNPDARLGAAQGRRDGTEMVAALKARGIVDGRPVFYDIEYSTWAAYPAGARDAWGAWQAVMHAAGHRHAFPYLPAAAGFGWAANWTGVRPTWLRPGTIGVQYEGNVGGRGYDLSVFDRALIGDTMDTVDVWAVEFTSPTNGQKYAAREWVIGADVAARQAAADVAALRTEVAALTKAVAALAGKAGASGAGDLTPSAIAAGLARALAAGASKA